MAVVRQEFYCNDCPPPGGFIMVPLNMSLNRVVVVVCPKCGRKHPRRIKDGQIYDEGGGSKEAEEILLTMSAWSNEPRSKKMMEQYRKSNGKYHLEARDGEVIKSPDDLVKKEKEKEESSFSRAWRVAFMLERWLEVADREKNG